jgi:hypothetical protein
LLYRFRKCLKIYFLGKKIEKSSLGAIF